MTAGTLLQGFQLKLSGKKKGGGGGAKIKQKTNSLSPGPHLPKYQSEADIAEPAL